MPILTRMQTIVSALALAISASLLPAVEPAPAEFYVSPSGNDAWSGRLAAVNAQKSDGPVASPQRARDLVRAMKNRPEGKNVPIQVYLRGGTYFLTEPLVLTPADSGTEEPNFDTEIVTYRIAPVTWSAYQGEHPVLSGGRKITGWKEATLEGKKVWAAAIPDAQAGKWTFDQLWVDGQRAQRSRWPQMGYLAIADVPEAKRHKNYNDGVKSWQFKEGDLKAWADVSAAMAVVMNRWVDFHLPVEKIDMATRTIICNRPAGFRLEQDDLYYLEGAKEFLQAPGQWWLDAQSGTLYYMPRPGQSIDRVEVIAPRLEQVLRLAGQPEQGKLVKHIEFRGLTFAHTSFVDPGGRLKFPQASVDVTAAIHGDGVVSCAWTNCEIAHISNYAIELAAGCRDNKITGCRMFDLGAGGVKIGQMHIPSAASKTSGNRIVDCSIYDGGRVYHSAVGVWIGQSPDNRLAHTLIHDFFYSGISVGWTWGYGPAAATGNIIENNHVHHIGVLSSGEGPILSDMGGIYTLGNHEGTVIRNNIFHDIAAIKYGGWAIYFDEGTTHILAENNLCYRTTHGGFHQHYGKENTVRNNIFAFARDWQIQRSRKEQHVSFTFERNIVYWNKGRLLDGQWGDDKFKMNNNVYWHAGDKVLKTAFAGADLAKWQARGLDMYSLIADPIFQNPAKDNFTLHPDSPAMKVGFVPLKLDTVGPRQK